MSYWRSLCLFSVVTMTFSPSTGAMGASQDAKGDIRSFLTKAAEEQQIEVSLGQLATQRAKNDRVKEFGAQMVEDSKMASRQIEELALKADVRLSPGVSQEHKRQVNELSQLFGDAFDREYMNYILRDRAASLEEFEQYMNTMPYPDIKQWIASTLPILEAHRKKAHVVKYSLQTTP